MPTATLSFQSVSLLFVCLSPWRQKSTDLPTAAAVGLSGSLRSYETCSSVLQRSIMHRTNWINQIIIYLQHATLLGATCTSAGCLSPHKRGRLWQCGLSYCGGGTRGAAGGWGELTKGTKRRIMGLSRQMTGSLLVLKYAGSTGSQVTYVPL